MKFYVDYVKERNGWEVIQNDHGFICYSITEQMVCIEELFIEKVYRQSKIGKTLVDLVCEKAQEKGFTHLYGVIHTNALTADVAMLGALKIGFSIIRAEGNKIIIAKKVG